MRRLISLSVLLLFILASCDAPMSQLNNSGNSPELDNSLTEMTYDASSSVGDSLRQKVWQQFRAKYGEKWKISWSEKNRNATIGVCKCNRSHIGSTGAGSQNISQAKPISV